MRLSLVVLINGKYKKKKLHNEEKIVVRTCVYSTSSSEMLYITIITSVSIFSPISTISLEQLNCCLEKKSISLILSINSVQDNLFGLENNADRSDGFVLKQFHDNRYNFRCTYFTAFKFSISKIIS
jgi:hypothetical protein